MPHINQLRPRGAGKDYTNGEHNCAPAVVAMLSRGHGKMRHLSDADLIQALGDGLVTKEGTTPQDVARMLARADVPHGGTALGSNYGEAEVQQQLKKGNMFMAQVRSFDPETRSSSAHYVLVRRMTPEGNYVVSDPLARRPYVVTPKQLREAVVEAPPDGGMLIPIPPPGAPAEAASRGAIAIPGTESSLLATQDEFPQLSRAPDPNAFRNQGDAFEDAPANLRAPRSRTGGMLGFFEDALGSQYSTSSISRGDGSRLMQANERRNHVALDITYSLLDAVFNAPRRPVTPSGKNPREYADELLRRKNDGDPNVASLLQQLEASSFETDRKVLEFIKKAELSQPGTGKKTETLSF